MSTSAKEKNVIVILATISIVFTACNVPQVSGGLNFSRVRVFKTGRESNERADF
jgi:hypothetical protein